MKIQTSMLISNMAGSLNGSTVRRSRYGLVLQNKASGLQNNTIALGTRRSKFAYLARQWTVLSYTQKQQWQDISNENPQTDRFGNPIILTGYAYYLKIQITMMMVGGGVVSADDYDNKVDTISWIDVSENGPGQYAVTAHLSGADYVERVVFFAVKVPTGSLSPFLNYKQFVVMENVVTPAVNKTFFINPALPLIPEQWYIGAFVVTENGGISPTVLERADW